MKSFEAQILEKSLVLGKRSGIDNPIAVLRDMNNNQEFDDDEVFFYTKDHLGSIRELVGLDGKLKQRQRYSAYGVTTREKNTDQLDRLIDHAYGFTGRELDSETGLYFYRARYYQPSDYVGRFISRDPIGFRSGDTNFYRYVSNKPFEVNDPTGKISFLSGAVCVAALGIGAAYDFFSTVDDAGKDIDNFIEQTQTTPKDNKSCKKESDEEKLKKLDEDIKLQNQMRTKAVARAASAKGAGIGTVVGLGVCVISLATF